MFDTCIQYASLGFEHVIPQGFDHILFILSIYFLASDLKSVVASCTVFTIAHSLSFGISVGGGFVPNSVWVEPCIAFSIVITAMANIVRIGTPAKRLWVIFFFGLVHGLGFARALQDVGLPSEQFPTALLSFNLGVEIGQLAVVLIAYLGLVRWVIQKPWYRSRVVMPASSIIGCIALYWTIERLLS